MILCCYPCGVGPPQARTAGHKFLLESHCHPICLTEFWTRERVIAHVAETSEVCKYNLFLCGLVLTLDEADKLDQQELFGQIQEIVVSACDEIIHTSHVCA